MAYRKGIAALAVMFSDTDLTEMLRDVDGANVGAVLKEVQDYREAGGPTLAFSRLLSRGAEQRPGEYLETNLAPVLAAINTAMRSVPLPSIIALLTFSGGYRPDVAEEIGNKIWRTQETRAIVQFCDHVADALSAVNTGDLAHATSHVIRAWSLLDRLSSDIRQEPSLYYISDLLRTMYIQVAFPAVVAYYAAYGRFPIVIAPDGSPRLPDYKRFGFKAEPGAADVADVAEVGKMMGLMAPAFGDPALTADMWRNTVRQYGLMQTTALKPTDVQRDPTLAKLLLWSGQGWNQNVLDSFVQAANLLKATARLVASPIAPGVFAAIAKEMRRAKTHADVALGFETAMVTLNKRGLSEQGGYEETGGFFMIPALAKIAGGLLGGGGGGGLLGGLLGGGGGGGLLGGLLGGGGGAGGSGGLLGGLPGGQLIGGLLKNLPFGSLLSGLFGGGRPQQSAPVQGAMGMFSGLMGLANDTQRAQASSALDSSGGQGPGILSGLLGSLLGKGGPDDEEMGGRKKRRKRRKKRRVVDTEATTDAAAEVEDRSAARIDSLLDKVEDLQDQLAEAKASASQGVPGVQSVGGGFSGDASRSQSTSAEFDDPIDEIDAVATGGADEEGGVVDETGETGGNASNDNNVLSNLV